MLVQSKPIHQLIPYVNNARTHNPDQIAKIASSIKEFGFNNPILIDKENGIIAGHGRLEAAKLLKIETVPVIELDHLSEAQKKAYILADNRMALDANWDYQLLKLEFENLKDFDFDVSLSGFNSDEINSILNPEIINDGLSDPDEIPELIVEPITKTGDLWILGNHRLMCGNSTKPLDVQILINDIQPKLMVTDPPYGVNYDPSCRDNASLGVGNRSIGKVENDNLADWTDAYSLFTGNIAYVWHAGKFTHIVAQNLIDCGFDLISQIIWAKNNFAISRGDYHWKHEPCWYVVKKGETHNWQGARDQSTLWEIKNTHQTGENAKIGHGTQKPIDCMRLPIINNSIKGDYIYDPFGGSGTTLIACEKENRKCVMMELDPNYCDLIIKRWEKFTGKKAELLTSENK